MTADMPPARRLPTPVSEMLRALDLDDHSWRAQINRWDEPLAPGAVPAVLIHGTWANSSKWSRLAPMLRQHGLPVFALDYGRDATSALGAMPGVYGTADMHASTRQLADFIDKVRRHTGSEQVNLVAHSQGGALVKNLISGTLAAGSKIRTAVTIGGTNHGTTAAGLGLLGLHHLPRVHEWTVSQVGMAALQQVQDSRFMQDLNALPDTQAGVTYVVFVSRFDVTSTPPEAGFLTAVPGATVHNVVLQDVSESRLKVGHDSMLRNTDVHHLVAWALAKAHLPVAHVPYAADL